MLEGGTIVARASGAGRSQRAIVRLSGPDTPDALRAVLQDAPTEPGAHRALLDLGGRALPVLLLLFPDGRSYTGESSAELQLPGNPALIDRVLAALCAVEGVRLANPGEYTARAYMSGRLSAEEAEGVMAVIAARSDAELAGARRLLAGETGSAYASIADDLAHDLALVEAGIDFVEEEDIVAITRGALLESLRALSARLEEITGGAHSREARAHRARVVLAGPANAGKSTLFNALLGRTRAVVSDTAGTTRDALEERLSLGPREPSVTLVDLAGLDEALTSASEIDANAQRLAREAIESADAVLWCDPSGRFETGELSLEGATVLRVRTKADLALDDREEGLRVCALDGFNMGPLRRAIADAATRSTGADARASVLPRHRRALDEAHTHIAHAIALLEHESGELIASPELTASALRAALDAMGEVAGAISPDDVLGRIFSSFCIGK